MTEEKNPTPATISGGRNLLANRMLHGFVRSKWYPGIFRWPTALVFLAIIYTFAPGTLYCKPEFWYRPHLGLLEAAHSHLFPAAGALLVRRCPSPY